MLIKSRKTYEVTLSILRKRFMSPIFKSYISKFTSANPGNLLPGKIQTLYNDTKGALENIKFS